MAAPHTTSLCPFANLVKEFTTISAPNFKGCTKAPVMNVLSTIKIALFEWAMLANTFKLGTPINGLETVSV